MNGTHDRNVIHGEPRAEARATAAESSTGLGRAEPAALLAERALVAGSVLVVAVPVGLAAGVDRLGSALALALLAAAGWLALELLDPARGATRPPSSTR